MGANRPREMVWDVVDSGGSEPWFVTLPSDRFAAMLADADAWSSGSWGELRATGNRAVYEEACEVCGFDPDLAPGGGDEESPPFDSVEFALAQSDDGIYAPWGSVWGAMWDGWPDDVAIEQNMEVDSLHDGFFLLIPGRRADEVIGWFRKAGIWMRRDTRMYRLLPPTE